MGIRSIASTVSLVAALSVGAIALAGCSTVAPPADSTAMNERSGSVSQMLDALNLDAADPKTMIETLDAMPVAERPGDLTSNSRDLQDLSSLIGERDEFTDSVTLGDHGTRSNQRSVRRIAIMPPERIRTLPFGTAVTLLRSAPPIITDLRAWTKRDDGERLKADRIEIEALLERGANGP